MRSTISDLHILEKDLSDHKLNVSEHYSKTADVKNSFEKVCDRLDAMQSTISKIDISVATLTAKIPKE